MSDKPLPTILAEADAVIAKARRLLEERARRSPAPPEEPTASDRAPNRDPHKA
jgi:hypothetical protein